MPWGGPGRAMGQSPLTEKQLRYISLYFTGLASRYNFQAFLTKSWAKKNKSWPKDVTSTVKAYCERTTIHGFSYCISPGKFELYFVQLFAMRLIILTFRICAASVCLDACGVGLIPRGKFFP